ncbi:hypothetical protein [Nonomuraea sp. GTA35]|uniref:hypothetical protein n=1 Tax=Nonomuraea sp. GTA35 TaxID=1676746 RepID=UPI0035BF324B
MPGTDLTASEERPTGDIQWKIVRGEASLWTTDGQEGPLVVPEEAWQAFVMQVQESGFDIDNMPRAEPAKAGLCS